MQTPRKLRADGEVTMTPIITCTAVKHTSQQAKPYIKITLTVLRNLHGLDCVCSV
jgi:hypothetical protein